MAEGKTEMGTMCFLTMGCLFCMILLLPALVDAGAIYNCVDRNGKSVLTDKPLGKDYKCTILERFKDATDTEREAWEKDRQSKTQQAVSEKPAEEGATRRQAQGGTGGPEGSGRVTGPEGSGTEGAASTGQQQGPPPQYRFPYPVRQQSPEAQDTLGVPSDTGATEGAPQPAAPQQPWGRSRYGYYPIPMPQSQQPQSDQQQQQMQPEQQQQ